MLTEERKQYILQVLDHEGIIRSQELMAALNASESTIRRDLKELEEESLIERVHGGAQKIGLLDFEQNMVEKSSENVHEKRQIAQYAASLIDKNEVIYLDAGTTTLAMVPFLREKNLTVVTNSVEHASALADFLIPTRVIGGNIKLTTKAILGSKSVQELKQYRFNKAFMGTNAFHEEYGYSTPDPEEAAMKTTAMEQADLAFVLADHTKCGQVSFAKVADLSQAAIITDQIPAEILRKISKKTTITEVSK